MFHYWNTDPFFTSPFRSDYNTEDPWSNWVNYDSSWSQQFPKTDPSLKSLTPSKTQPNECFCTDCKCEGACRCSDNCKCKNKLGFKNENQQMQPFRKSGPMSQMPSDWAVTEKGGKVRFSLRDLPEHLDKESVHVSVENGSLCLSGKTKREDKERGFMWKSSFYKSHKLPEDIDPNSARVHWKDNRLNVEFSRFEKDTKQLPSSSTSSKGQDQGRQLSAQKDDSAKVKIQKLCVNTKQLPLTEIKNDVNKGMTYLNLCLPEGVKQDDIELDVHNHRVCLSIRDQESKSEEGDVTFTRINRWMPAIWYLPPGVPSSSVQAKMTDDRNLQICFPSKANEDSIHIGIQPFKKPAGQQQGSETSKTSSKAP